jgi:hypothetical protein
VSEQQSIFVEEISTLYSGRKPHYTEEQLKEAYADKYIVAFVDVLGFSSMIQDDPKGETFIPLVERAIQDALVFTNVIRKFGNATNLEYRIFSDNICFWMPARYHALSCAVMLSVLAEFQLALVCNGVFCRGGVALGYHYASDYVLYGPALVEAVKIEHSTSSPCISISNAIVEDIHLIMMALQLHEFHKIRKDGSWFVNYLSKIFYIEKEKSLNIIERHHCIVKEKLDEYRHAAKILAKYKWVADYHNDLVNMITFKDECAIIA